MRIGLRTWLILLILEVWKRKVGNKKNKLKQGGEYRKKKGA